nr:unnamed protein product [Digitaria exilis]
MATTITTSVPGCHRIPSQSNPFNGRAAVSGEGSRLEEMRQGIPYRRGRWRGAGIPSIRRNKVAVAANAGTTRRRRRSQGPIGTHL